MEEEVRWSWADELRELRQLRKENAKRKHLAANLSLNRHVLLKSLQKPVRPRVRRELAEWTQQVYRLSQRGVA